MNKLCVTVFAIGCIFFSPLQPNAGAVQVSGQADEWAPGVWMAQALDNIVSKAEAYALGTDLQFGLDRDRVCLLGGFMEEGQTLSFSWTFEAGERIVMIGGGDTDVVDLDLSITRKGSEVVLDEDTLIDATPILDYTIPTAGKYTVHMELYSSTAPSFCGLSLMREGDRPFDLDAIVTAASSFLVLGAEFNQKIDGGLSFPENQWSIFGGVLSPNESSVVEYFDFSDASYAVFGVSQDIERYDLDIALSDDAGTELEADRALDGWPFVVAPRNAQVSVEINQSGGTSDAFGVFGILAGG